MSDHTPPGRACPPASCTQCRSLRRTSGGLAALLTLGCLLGVGAAGAGAAPSPLQSAVSTQHPGATSALRLTGIVTSSTLHVLRAVIAARGAGERSYGIGDTLPDGSTLAAIQADRVVVRRDGSERVVLLEGFDDVLAAPPPPQAAPTRPSPQAPSATVGATPRDLVAAARANPVVLLDSLPVEAILDRHRMVALRVGKPDDASLMNEFKLLPGDVITAINGVALNGPDQEAWMHDSAPASTRELTLTVYRDGRTETLRY